MMKPPIPTPSPVWTSMRVDRLSVCAAGVGVEVGVGLAVGVTVAVGVGDGGTVDVAVGVGLAAGVTVAVEVGDGGIVAVAVGVGDGGTVAVAVGVGDGGTVAVAVGVGLGVRCYTGRDSNIINVFFIVEGAWVGHVTSGIIRNDGHVIANLVLVRITKEWIKGSTNRHVGRPRIAGVDAVRIEELRIGVVGGVSGVQPNAIEPSVWRDRNCAEPVPLAVIDRIIIDPVWGAEGLSAVCAAHEHHVNSGTETSRLQAPQHVNVIIRLVPERSAAMKSCPFNPTGLIKLLPTIRPPMLTVVTWSKVGVTAPFLALVERMQ